jgi:hypothetical protein
MNINVLLQLLKIARYLPVSYVRCDTQRARSSRNLFRDGALIRYSVAYKIDFVNCVLLLIFKICDFALLLYALSL